MDFSTVVMVKRSLLLIMSVIVSSAYAQEDLNVISNGKWLEYTDASNTLYRHLREEAYRYLSKRKDSISAISSLEGWKDRQARTRQILHEITGPFPKRTPLNAKVVRNVKKDFYQVEHIIFESQPGFYVTSSLFLPNAAGKRGKAPAVIYCSGHAPEGYRSDTYQHIILNLVKKGFIVFAFDPVGQGERLEYYDAHANKSKVGGPTSEHSYPGAQAFITGGSQARFMIWDGIRAVDYLISRREVDAERIGITGRSGGGTQSSYIAAFDDRILAVAPECYITSFSRLLESIGPQDAEQNFLHGISRGIDHPDLLLVRAPKPALMITTTRDMFSIQGARETASEVRRIYGAYNRSDDFGIVEDDAAHASTQKNREAMYAFFQKHLSLPGSSADETVPLLTREEMRVTTTGQVATSLGGETVHTLNRKEAQARLHALEKQRSDFPNHLTSVLEAARSLSGYREPHGAPQPVFTGRIQRNGYAVEKYFLKGEGDYVIPYLLFVPENATPKAILYLHPSGKNAEASDGGEIADLAASGFTVLAPDLPGTGELGPGAFRGDAYIDGVSHNVWYTSILIGRSIVGLHAGDIARLVNVLKNGHPAKQVYALARKEMTPSMLHAAAFLPEIEGVVLIEPLPSYRTIVMNRFYHSGFIPAAVAAALTKYDLPDLAASLAPGKLLIIPPSETLDAHHQTEKDYNFIRSVYRERGAWNQLQITDDVRKTDLSAVIAAWLE